MLIVTTEKEKAMSELEDTAIQVVHDAIKRGGDMDESERAAVKALNVVSKNRQTSTARAGLAFHMAEKIFDGKELRRYVETTSPFKPEISEAKP